MITDDDRAAMRRAAELVPCPVPPLAPGAEDFHRATLAARAVRT